MLFFAKKSIVYFFFFLFCTNAFGVSLCKDNSDLGLIVNKRFSGNSYNEHPVKFYKKGEPPKFIKIGAGVGVWYTALQPHFAPYRRPLSVFAEYRKDSKPFAYAVEANVLSVYAFGQFLLKPMYFCIYPKVYLSGFAKTPKWFDAYLLAGGQLSYTRFTENKYTGISGYQHKVESSIKPGIIVGAGFSLLYKNFEISPRISFQSGRGSYYAGYFTKQNFNTSTTNAIIYITYKFPIFRHKIHCPAYR